MKKFTEISEIEKTGLRHVNYVTGSYEHKSIDIYILIDCYYQFSRMLKDDGLFSAAFEVEYLIEFLHRQTNNYDYINLSELRS